MTGFILMMLVGFGYIWNDIRELRDRLDAISKQLDERKANDHQNSD